MFDDDFLQNEIVKNMEKIENSHVNKFLRTNLRDIFNDVRNECKDFRNNVFYKKMADLDDQLDNAYIRHKKNEVYEKNKRNGEKQNEEGKNKDEEYEYKQNNTKNKDEYEKNIQNKFDKKEYFEDNNNKKKGNINNDYYYKYDDLLYKIPYKTETKKIIQEKEIEKQEEEKWKEGEIEEFEEEEEKYDEREMRINNGYNLSNKKNIK